MVGRKVRKCQKYLLRHDQSYRVWKADGQQRAKASKVCANGEALANAMSATLQQSVSACLAAVTPLSPVYIQTAPAARLARPQASFHPVKAAANFGSSDMGARVLRSQTLDTEESEPHDLAPEEPGAPKRTVLIQLRGEPHSLPSVLTAVQCKLAHAEFQHKIQLDHGTEEAFAAQIQGVWEAREIPRCLEKVFRDQGQLSKIPRSKDDRIRLAHSYFRSQ